MAKYELLTTIDCSTQPIGLYLNSSAELVHMDDPATMVMTDYYQTRLRTIDVHDSMDDALNEMKATGVHLLLVTDDDHVVGVVGSEDLLGEKPIQLIQERRIPRAKVLVKMIMEKIDSIVALDINDVEQAKVGNIVNTLQALKQHYALVLKTDGVRPILRGLFTTSQIGKKLHMDIANSIGQAGSVSELQKRKS